MPTDISWEKQWKHKPIYGCGWMAMQCLYVTQLLITLVQMQWDAGQLHFLCA